MSTSNSKKEPRIIGLSMVKNEQDIIEPFIRHNIRFLDDFVIMDNASVDNTRNIILSCVREFDNLLLSDSDEFKYNQSQRMTKMLQYCQSAFFADYVVFLDADEFISCRDRTSFIENLELIPRGGVGRMPWQTFVVMPGQECSVGNDAPRSFTHRRATEHPPFYKAAVRLDGEYLAGLSVTQGNHDVLRQGSSLPSVNLDQLPLKHFPVRSGAQLAAKGAVGWTAYLARNPGARENSEGFQWRDAFDRLTQGGVTALSGDLVRASMEYAQSKGDQELMAVCGAAPSDYQRLYSDGNFMDPSSIIALSWERSLCSPKPKVSLKRPSQIGQGTGLTDTSFDGAWHWDHLFFDVQPFRFMAEKYQPDSVLDIGCGIGQYLALFKAFGATDVFGVDGLPIEYTEGVLDFGEYVAQDLSKPIDLGRKFDIVICVEVAEHLHEIDGPVLVDTIARHADRVIIFSAAEPGQPGHGHINCQPLAYWLEHWRGLGWIPDLTDTLGIRALATMSWFRRNLVVLKLGRSAEGQDAIDALIEIAKKEYLWYGQAPGIRESAFSAPIFGLGEAYHTSRD